MSTAATSAAPRVAIVGGGLAGLAAAVGLSGHGLRIELFEARRQLGGRATSFRDPSSGEMVDHCQHVSLGCCTNLDNFCRRTGLDHLMERHSTLHFFGPDGRRYDLAASPMLPAPLHLLPSLLRLKYLSRRERIGIMRGLRALAKSQADDDATGPTIDWWLREHGQSPRAIELFWTPVIVSALSESLDRAAVAPVRKVFVDAFLASRRAYEMQVPRVALGEFYGKRLETWLIEHGVQVHLACPIKQLFGDAKAIGTLEYALGQPQEFDAVVLALPWRRVCELLPEQLRTALPELARIDQLQSAPITAVHLWFDRPITELPHAVLPGRTSQWLFRRGTQHVVASPGDPTVTGHYYQVVISASHELEGESRDDILAKVLRELAEVWPVATQAKLLQSRIVTEQNAVFSVAPGVDALRPSQRTNISNLFLAGDWTATGWPATMEGAVRSGYLAAEGLLAKMAVREKILADDLPRPWLARMLGM
jgi:squalene-associated FAD-dependent desaturase